MSVCCRGNYVGVDDDVLRLRDDLRSRRPFDVESPSIRRRLRLSLLTIVILSGGLAGSFGRRTDANGRVLFCRFLVGTYSGGGGLSGLLSAVCGRVFVGFGLDFLWFALTLNMASVSLINKAFPLLTSGPSRWKRVSSSENRSEEYKATQVNIATNVHT